MLCGSTRSPSRLLRVAALRSALYVVPSLEALHATRGIHEVLLARVEGVALGADFHLDVPGGRLGLYHVPAGAGDGRQLVQGMRIGLHIGILLLKSAPRRA